MKKIFIILAGIIVVVALGSMFLFYNNKLAKSDADDTLPPLDSEVEDDLKTQLRKACIMDGGNFYDFDEVVACGIKKRIDGNAMSGLSYYNLYSNTKKEYVGSYYLQLSTQEIISGYCSADMTNSTLSIYQHPNETSAMMGIISSNHVHEGMYFNANTNNIHYLATECIYIADGYRGITLYGGGIEAYLGVRYN